MDPASSAVTRLLDQARRGEPGATEQLLPLVYDELRRLARSRMRFERPGHTLQPTALVHEAYLRLMGAEGAWEGRGHFFAAAAEAMRRILIERARRARRLKRGGDLHRVELDDQVSADGPRVDEVLAVDEALGRLEALDAQMAAVVKLRYFGGLTVEETAQALGTSPRTVNRLWTGAKAWLRSEIPAARERTGGAE
ncbi:MAG TPA: sigma-70 family RNA polymerase sigma factor [Vicinamibacteria bacterium]|jgi:RNA polymerase sigma factor (TIGR02999 family)